MSIWSKKRKDEEKSAAGEAKAGDARKAGGEAKRPAISGPNASKARPDAPISGPYAPKPKAIGPAVQKDGKKDKKKETHDEMGPLLPWISELATDDLLAGLLEIKKSRFGRPSAKLESDIMKRLGISKDEALNRGSLLAYSRLPDVSKKLDSLRQKRLDKSKEKAPEKKVEKQAQPVKMGVEKPLLNEPAPAPAKDITTESKEPVKTTEPQIRIKPSSGTDTMMGRMSGSTTSRPTEPLVHMQGHEVSDSKITERLKSIESAMGDKQKYENAEAKKKKRRTGMGAAKKPFIAIRNAINSAFAKIAKAVFLLFATLFSIPINLGRMILKVVGGLLQSFYRRVGGVSPFGWKKKINQLVIYSGTNKTQEQITGMTIVNGGILAILIFAIGFFLFGLDLIMSAIIALGGFGAVWVVVYSILNLMADKRSDEVEGALPDVLQIVSANISAGMTPYNALWVSARKEFGALAEEIKIAQKETLGGKPFASSLTDMGSRVRSHILQRTIRLIIQGMKAGGELPNILQGIGADIRQMRLLQREMAANTMSYILFIMFGMLLGAPLLFSVSIQFVDIVNKFQPDVNVDMSTINTGPSASGGGGGFNMMALGGGKCPKDFDSDGIPDTQEKDLGLNPKNASDAQSIDPDTGETYLKTYQKYAEPMPASCITSSYLSFFAMMALASIAFFGSLLIGFIKEGKQTAGLKIMPLLMVGTLGMFWLMNTGMSWFFGSMFG